MKKIIALLLSLQLSFVSLAQTYPAYLTGESPRSGQNSYPIGIVCDPIETQSESLEDMALIADQICVEALNSRGLPADIDNSFKFSEILPMIGGCLMGAKDAVVDELTAIKWLIELFVKEIPSYIWNKVKSIFEDKDIDDPLAQVEKAAETNDSIFKEAYDTAMSYLQTIKKFVGEIKEMIKEQYKAFFCLPKPQQSRLLCRLVSDVFLIAFSPSKFIKGAKWTGKVATSANKLIRTMADATQQSKGITDKADEVSRLLTASKAITPTTLVSKLPNGSSLVSKKVGDELVYYLETTSKNGEKLLREMVLDNHSGFFSINGQGKKVIDKLIRQGNEEGQSAAILLDVNNLGKVNYFEKGLTAGDDYIKTVSDVIRETVKDNPNIHVFRTGGDELTILTKGLDPDDVFKLSKEINEKVLTDKSVQKIFRDEKSALGKQFGMAKKAGDTEKIKELELVRKEVNKLDGSVTVGAHMIGPKDTYDSIQTMINSSLSPAKATYKKSIGLPYEKYGATLDNVGVKKVGGKPAPPVLEPTGVTPSKKPAPRAPPKSITYNPNFEYHMTKFDGFSQGKGINGTHNSEEFLKAATEYNVKIVEKIPHPKVKGLYQIEYKIPSRDAQTNAITGYKKKTFQKTIYDPKVYSDEKMISLAKEAAEEGFKEAIENGQRVYDVSKDGINFVVYINNGVIDNIHPAF